MNKKTDRENESDGQRKLAIYLSVYMNVCVLRLSLWCQGCCLVVRAEKDKGGHMRTLFLILNVCTTKYCVYSDITPDECGSREEIENCPQCPLVRRMIE